MKCGCLLAAVLTVGVGTQLSVAQLDPSQRTADLPDSWLVLYNVNNSESIAWKDWYIQEWGIPVENALGLDVSNDERIHRDDFRDRIFYPVRNHLDAHPELAARVMGILVGYHVPGNFYRDDTHPPLNGGGGWSVASNLQDMNPSNFTFYKRTNPHCFVARVNPDVTRLTKATLAVNIYLAARLDGPCLAEVQALTTRARTITGATGPLPGTDRLYYDYLDVGAPAGDEWAALKCTVESEYLTTPAWRFPWAPFESESESTPDCAMRFCYYRITGWQTVPWGGSPPGSRIVGMAMNSWGATTVRSTTDHAGRYVPNALFNGGFAAAFGATAEPYLGNEPHPDTIVWCLSQGQTLAEAALRANPRVNYMWEVVGDPLLRVPYWFVPNVNVPPAPPSDLGPTDYVGGGETAEARPTLTFNLFDENPQDELQFRLQIDNDSDFSSPVVDFASEWLPQGAASFTVGQPIWDGGFYLVGQINQALAPGAYYWRVRSHDGTVAGEWASANNGQAAFVVYDPLRLIGAASRKMHGSRSFDLEILLDEAQSAANIEPRRGNGRLSLVFFFNKPFTALDGALDETEIVLSAGALDVIAVSGSRLIVELRDVPDDSCLTVSLTGLCDWAGRALAGEHDIQMRILCGDVNCDGLVSLVDMALSKAVNGEPLTAATARYDVNCDGLINLADMALVSQYTGRIATCP